MGRDAASGRPADCGWIWREVPAALQKVQCRARVVTAENADSPMRTIGLSSAAHYSFGVMRFLLTGGTGFVGGTLARLLLREGHSVDVIARSPEKAADLAALGVT